MLLDSVILATVRSLEDLIDPKTDKYFNYEVNIIDSVYLNSENLIKFPVQFGKIGSDFHCHGNKLTSLEGASRKVNGHFYCFDNHLTSLESAPQEINGYLNCSHNKITSLEGVHKIIHKVGRVFNVSYNPIKSGGIGLLLIEGLELIISDLPVFHLIGKYLGQGKAGLLRCQEELIEAGFEEYAKL